MRVLAILLLEVAGKTLSPYETLGLKPTASQKEIKRAYLEAALKWHPDKNPSAEAQQRFIEITEAYNHLTGLKTERPRAGDSRAGAWKTRVNLEEALRTFAESMNLGQFMKNGKIDWQKVDQQVSQLVTSAVESVAGALRQRYYNDDGSLKWKQVLGDTAVAGAALFMAAFREHEEM